MGWSEGRFLTESDSMEMMTNGASEEQADDLAAIRFSLTWSHAPRGPSAFDQLVRGVGAAPDLPPSLVALRALVPEFCRRHGISRLEAFGSVARGEAHAGSDVDLLVTFGPGIQPGLEFFEMADELESMLGCRVDFLTRRSVERDRNEIRRRLILEGAREIYRG